MPSPLTSLVETTACRLPTSTRSPTSSPSERSDSSTRPSRTSTPCETPRTATASAASAPARRAASTRRCANELSADWSNRSEVAASAESDDAADGEEITNEIPAVEDELWKARQTSAEPSDVLDSCVLQAFSAVKSQRFRAARQGLVNHVSQGLVNHADEWRPGDLRLTSLFKLKPTRLWQGLSHRPGT